MLVSSTSTSARLKWSPPGSNGGCPVTEFRLLRDDGAGGSITTIVDDTLFDDKPNLYEHEVDLTGFKGKKVRFRLQVSNQIGDSKSTSFVTILVAGLPVIDGSITINDDTSGTQLSFTIPIVTDDGGSYVQTYHVEMDDGQGGDWHTISGYPFDSLQTSFIITQGVKISYTYSVRYRVRNSIGWSDYSDITYILASEAPSMPTRPMFVDSTSTILTVEFGLSSSNGGSAISSYTYQIDKEDGNGFSDVTTYTSSSTQVNFDIDGLDSSKLQPGQMYKFRSYATNKAGHVSYSLETRIRAAAVPAQPSAGPTIVQSISNTTSIGVTWDAVENTYAYVSGYKLYRDDGNNGNFTLIYDGTNRPGQRTFVSHNLKPGVYYRFKVLAVNYNGDGLESDESVIPACLPPSGLSPPVVVSSTETLIKLSWSSPSNLNGCSLTGWKLYQNYATNFPLTSANEVFALTLNTSPAARSIDVPFTNSADIGKDFIFQLLAINDAGSVSSGTIQVTLAAVPTAPSAGPTRIADRTNSTHITIQILDQPGEPDLNGGTLKKVHVEMDNSGDGNYTSIIAPDDACIDTIFTISERVVASKTYQFRYRIMNENGWSDYSPVSRITAASAPSSPPRPSLGSATDSQITLLFSRPDYNGGAPITNYQLYINKCDQASEPTFLVSGYTSNLLTHTATITELSTDTGLSITSGMICGFSLRAINSQGYYADSDVFIAAIANQASAPTAPTKVESSSSHITVTWSEVSSTESPGGDIRGYRLYMRKTNGGDKQIIYQNLNLKSVREYTATGLEAGQEYTFSVQAYQLNGFTDEGPSETFKTCGEPSYLYPPILLSASTTEFELQWEPPLSCGGCSIVEYALSSDFGAGGDLSAIDTSDFTGEATKLTHTVTGTTNIPAGSEGKTFMFKLAVKTEGGTIESEEIGYTLASVPGTPTTAPQSDTSVTSNKVIKIDVAIVADTGYSPITSYSIEYNDGVFSGYRVLYGDQVDSLSTTYTLLNVVEGNTYKFRYRVRNIVGWSGYSPIGYITAQTNPAAPAPPEFVTATDSDITLNINFVTENKGSLISYHELYRDGGDSGATWIKVASYDGTSIQTIVNKDADASNLMTTGVVYQFKVRGYAGVGNEGEFSNPISVALARPPEQLAAPTHVTSMSSQTRITISWIPLTDRDTPGGAVTGFKVYMAEGAGGVFSQVYSTKSVSSTTYTATGLTPGRTYRFKVSAFNLNEEETISLSTTMYACENVRGIFAPAYESATSTTMVVSWKEPVFNGGCPVKSYNILIDNGVSGNPTTPVIDLGGNTYENMPTLRQATIYSLTTLGTNYALKLQVTTAMGTFESEIVTITFAIAPPKPNAAPSKDASKSSSTKITVLYSTTDNGGSPLLGYQLQYGVGLSGGFSNLISSSASNMATSYTLLNTIQGQNYYFRFRAKNKYGWGDYSDVGYIIAAEAPMKSNIPILNSVSSTSITLDLDQTVNNMGSLIIEYELYWASGATPLTFVPVSTYDKTSSSVTLPQTVGAVTDSIAAGQIYHFKYAARNSITLGEFSEILSVAAANELSAPANLRRDDSSSSTTQITMTWDAVTSTNSPGEDILGYRLYLLDDATSQYVVVYDGQVEATPNKIFYTYTNVVESNMYIFRVTALTFNGENKMSDQVTTYACNAPSGMSAPVIEAVTLSTISISWSAPASTGS